MDFGALPPEVNSGRMYTGPGAGPMLAAAAAWDALAAELHSTAVAYASTIEGLTVGTWLGPTSIAMSAAAAPYVSWISATANQADQAATQAKIAASAYEAAFTATVPPPVIAANRAQLLALIATNIFGQNTPAIAATEAQYLEMWAQDAAAMYSYAGSSSTATQLTPFSEPPQTTNASGRRRHGIAAHRYRGRFGYHHATIPIHQFAAECAARLGIHRWGVADDGVDVVLARTRAATNRLGDAATGGGDRPGELEHPGVHHYRAVLCARAYCIPGGPFLSFGQVYAYAQNGQGLQSFFAPAKAASGSLAPIANSLGANLTSASVGGAPVSGTMGRAALVGSMSVPQGWTTAAPAIRTVAQTLSANLANLAAAAPTASMGEAGVFGQMALSSLAGRALGATAAGSGGSGGAVAASLGGVVAEADPAAAMIFVLPALED